MEDIVLHCPFCCKKEFNSKQSLAEHLSSIHITCPICKNEYFSMDNLIQHLNVENCEATNDNCDNIENNADDISFLKTSGSENEYTEGQLTTECIKMTPEDSTAINKMYVELLSKPLMKPCLQTQELKLVIADGESRYMVLTNEDPVLSMGNVVTKQNNDGTISLTTVKESKIASKSDPPSTTETESDDSQLEIYSCNTCGVSFSSVLEHVQNYHNDQEVVVEEESLEELHHAVSEDIEYNVTEEPTDKLTLRRMITETGDIIEAPLLTKVSEAQILSAELNKIGIPLKMDILNKQDHTRRFVQVDKFCTSLIKDITLPSVKSGPYHNVIIKEVKISNGNKIKVYNCMTCNLTVPTLAEFKNRPCEILKYSCPHCPVAYENSKSLCAHMKVHKTRQTVYEGSSKNMCGICSIIFPTSKSLKLHKRMHDPVKSRPIDPPVATSDGRAVSDDKYLCSICNKLIPIDYRVVHQNSHKSNDKMNCNVCNKKFSSKEYLDMHMSVHTVDKVVIGKQDKPLPYTCLYCSRQFARPHEKVKHERIHTGEKPHSCEICGKSFRVSYCLTLHMRTHTGARPYACPHCEKRFKAHSVYNHHLLTHSEVRAYKCPYCPKAFKTSVQLAGHKNSHTKPFSCQQCNRPFASLYAVRVHMEIHARQNSLKFSCALCGASYARAFALNDHMRTAHARLAVGLKDDEWMMQDNGDGDEEDIQKLHKDIDSDINELEINANELIIP